MNDVKGILNAEIKDAENRAESAVGLADRKQAGLEVGYLRKPKGRIFGG